ncbi:MAG: ABC transporter substrate-binding protein [Pseudomonadota bacterium]|nr:ABC transporter substrate-binding protein [Pseudomonadota bacterium]
MKILKKLALGLTLGASAALAGQAANAESVLRVGMTAGDIPIVLGQPDQGFEGYRFVGYNLYDPLVLWDLSQGDTAADIKPGLATSWKIDPNDNKRWLITLRKGVKWHDGCDFVPEDVVWNLDRIANKDAPQFNVKQFGMIRNRTGNIDKVEVLGDHEIAIVTKTPDALFPYQLSYWFMISKCRLTELNNDYEAYAKAPSGTGPYKFDSIVPQERLELVKNSEYWDKNRVPKHDRLVLLPIPEATTRAAALLSGQVDFIEAPSPDTIPRLQSAGMAIVTTAYPHNWSYQLNFVDGNFKKKEVRQAANYALNRAEFKALLNGYMVEGFTNVPPSTPYHGTPSIKYDYDPKKATALLKSAGCYPCKIKLAISTSGSGQMQPLPMNELVKSQLDAVGFETELQVMDWNALLDITRPGREKSPTVDGINVSRALQDPFSALIRHVYTKQHAPKGSNWGHYTSAKADALIDEIYLSFDPAVRMKKLTELHELMVEDAVMLWVAHDVNPRALAPNIKGFIQAQSWFQDLTPIVVE